MPNIKRLLVAAEEVASRIQMRHPALSSYAATTAGGISVWVFTGPHHDLHRAKEQLKRDGEDHDVEYDD